MKRDNIMINTWRDAQRGIPLSTGSLGAVWVGHTSARPSSGGQRSPGEGALREHCLRSPGDQQCPGGSRLTRAAALDISTCPQWKFLSPDCFQIGGDRPPLENPMHLN